MHLSKVEVKAVVLIIIPRVMDGVGVGGDKKQNNKKQEKILEEGLPIKSSGDFQTSIKLKI